MHTAPETEIDWAARKAAARAFLLNPPKAKRAWSTLRYEYDKESTCQQQSSESQKPQAS